MSPRSPARERFRALVNVPDPVLPLAEAAACIAWEDQGVGAPDAVLRRLDTLATGLQPRLAGLHDHHQVVAVMIAYLCDELGFRGNTDDYHDPANSYLDRVLERYTGLPITLSVVYMEVGWRLGLPFAGVALPGHFIIRYGAPDGDIYIDPFNGGRLWSYADCEQQITTAYGNSTPELIQHVMDPPTKRSILLRMLRNLKHTYLTREDIPRALATVERCVMLDHTDPHEIRDRGLLRLRLGQAHAALEDLERYTRLAPAAPDVAQLRELMRALAAQLMGDN